MDAGEATEYLGENPSRFPAAATGEDFDRCKDIGGYKYSRDDLDEWWRAKMGHVP